MLELTEEVCVERLEAFYEYGSGSQSDAFDSLCGAFALLGATTAFCLSFSHSRWWSRTPPKESLSLNARVFRPHFLGHFVARETQACARRCWASGVRR